MQPSNPISDPGSERAKPLSKGEPVIAIARPKGMPFEEFKKRCVQAFIEKGIIKPEQPQSLSNSEDPYSKQRRSEAELIRRVKAPQVQEMLDGMRSQLQKPPDVDNA